MYSINSLLKIYYVYVTDLVVAYLKESYNLVGSGMTQWIKWILKTCNFLDSDKYSGENKAKKVDKMCTERASVSNKVGRGSFTMTLRMWENEPCPQMWEDNLGRRTRGLKKKKP